MSFRARLTTFFVLIVVVPMIAMGVLMFRLISDSQQGKADARAGGLASAAASLYQSEVAAARADAETLARAVGRLKGDALTTRFASLARQAGLARARLSNSSTVLVDVGDKTAIAPGAALLKTSATGPSTTVTVSELTASQYAHDLAAPGVAVAVKDGPRLIGSTINVPPGTSLPANANVTVGGVGYRAVGQTFRGFNGAPVTITVLSALSATSASLGGSRVIAAVLIVAFLALALAFALLASRALQARLKDFLQAARRLAGGDFSSLVPVEGHDEFAALGEEFNRMSTELSQRLDELSQERARLREAIRRTGHTFASSLDRAALLEVALKTAVDAVQANGGRLSVRSTDAEPLAETAREGSLVGLEGAVQRAEQAALDHGGFGEEQAAGVSVAALTLGSLEPQRRAHGLITVARRERPFDDDDREVLRSLAAEAALALENVELHFQVRRQAVTDELTGLANHGRFQELLNAEIEQVRRYHHPIGLVMLDIDDFKAVNDTYGHPQGDAVLRQVARVLRENSRDADSPARYGGEELSLILPHTDLEGAHAIAERIRSAVAGLRVRRTDGNGVLRVTASVGVTASTVGDKDELIADADSALYEAKRRGKNRTVAAEARLADAPEPR
ncbi:MAG TPA: diguanylate cyclase [Solirubrobacteraceae bacterium]|nr:diguanylate cyclase [Solirubrobacteraceae bacterium]